MAIGSGGDLTFGVRITADNEVFIDGVRASTEEVDKLGRGLRRVAKDADEAARGQESLTGAVAKGTVAADVAREAARLLTDAFAQMVTETRSAQQETLRLEAVLNATRESAGRTAAQINGLANELARATKFDDDEVRRAAATLASFGVVAGDAFDRTLKAAADMSAVFGGDLNDNAAKLAKALADPANSLGALERSFGRLPPAIRAAVKEAAEFGDTARAQEMILAEVESRVGGSAVNAYSGLERQLVGTKKAWDDLLKAVGSEIFDAKAREAGVLERAFVSMADNFTTRAQTIKGLFESDGWLARMGSYVALLRGDLGGAAALSSAADAASTRRAGAPGASPADFGPQIPGGVLRGRQDAQTRFDDALSRTDPLGKFKAELAQAARDITTLGIQGTEEAERLMAQIVDKYSKQRRTGTDQAKKDLADYQRLLREAGRSAEEMVRAEERQDDAYRGLLDKLEGVVRASEQNVSLLGVDRGLAADIRKETELRADAERVIATLRPEQQEGARAQLEIAIEALRTERERTAEYRVQVEEARRLAEEQRAAEASRVAVWDELSSRVANVATGISRWKDELRSFVRELLAIVAKKWVLQFGAMLTGSSALAAQAGGVGENTVAGAALNWGGNALSSSLGFSGGLGSFGGFQAGFTAQSAFLSGAAESAPVAGTLAGQAGQWAASAWEFMAPIMANPITWIVAAVVAVGAILNSRRGGDKEGGSYFGAWSADGRWMLDAAVPGSDNGRFFTPSGGDSVARQWANDAASAFYLSLERLGGTTGALRFGFGFDKDPRGTADSRVSALVTRGDGSVLYSHTQTGGRDDEDFNRAVGLETRRAVLAALQGSALPEAIEAILATVEAASATAEQIDSILALADAFGSLLRSTENIDAASIVAEASRSSSEVFRAQGEALADLGRRSSVTTESLATLTNATNAYRASAAQLILGLEAAKREIDSMFGQTARNISMAGLTDAQRYQFYQDESARLYGQIGTATSAEEIQRIAAQINEDVSSAFALLTPEQQASLKDEYLARLDNVNQVVQDRLTALQDAAQEEANTTLDRIETMMTDLATRQSQAADKQVQAADDNLEAARTPIELTIKVDTVTGAATVNG